MFAHFLSLGKDVQCKNIKKFVEEDLWKLAMANDISVSADVQSIAFIEIIRRLQERVANLQARMKQTSSNANHPETSLMLRVEKLEKQTHLHEEMIDAHNRVYQGLMRLGKDVTKSRGI